MSSNAAAIVLVACLAFAFLTFVLGLAEAIGAWREVRRDRRAG